MTNQPLVSIVIPVYNGSNYMREAIDSALNQTYENCEVIVVNDGSNDNGETEKIALSYGDKIRYLTKENGGVASAINLGITEMRGEYFAWLSHDDVFYPDKINLQIEAIQKSGDFKAVCHGNFDFLQMNSGEKTNVDLLSLYDKEQLEMGCFAPVFLAIHGSTVLIHKSHFDRVGKYKTDLLATQDSEFLFRVMRGQKSVFVEQSLIIGRLHDEQGQKTMKCHKPEYNRMFENFCKELTDGEKIEMCGSPINFYYNLWKLLKTSSPADSIISFLEQKIKMLHTEYFGISNKINNAIDFFEGLINAHIYIFGAGNYGRNMLKCLKDYEINVDGFIDNDDLKVGTIIDGVRCFAPYDINDIHKAIIIIAVYSGIEEIQKQLAGIGIERKNIMSFSDINRKLFRLYPIHNSLVEG